MMFPQIASLAWTLSALPLSANPYPDAAGLPISPGNTTYFVEPVRGNDDHNGKVVIEGNTINSTMPGVLIEDDANFWWESSCVRDLTIRNNTFLHCGIAIAPNAPQPDGPVHENIRIEGNTFIGEAMANHYRGKCPFITAHGVNGLTITGNRFDGDKASWMRVEKCEAVKDEGNESKMAK